MRLPAARRWFALGFLALGGFAIGANEFVAMGVLPRVADDLLSAATALNPAATVAEASVFVWGYALGVVIGAPVFGAYSTRFRQKSFLLVSLGLMAALTLATALAPGLPAVAALRILTGLPHGAYFGVAAIVAAGLMGERHEARGVAVVLGGLTIANLVGTPAGTWLGQVLGWRWSYAAIAVLFAVAVCGAAVALPRSAAPTPAEHALGSLWHPRVWTAVGGYAVLNGSLFAALTFTAPIATSFAGVDPVLVILVVALTGLGMTIGNYVGGWLADRGPRAAMCTTLVAATLGFVFLGASVVAPPVLFAGFALLGVALGCVAPYVQVRLMRAVPRNPQLGASMNSLTANLGSVVGGVLASIAVAGQGSYGAAIVVGATMLVTGGAASIALARADARRAGRGSRSAAVTPVD
jgi:DHA1 family inner membrane transport protein